MKTVPLALLILAVLGGTYVANRQAAAEMRASADQAGDPIETQLPEQLEAPATALNRPPRHTSFVPLKPAETPAPALLARFEIVDEHGTVLENVQLVRKEARVFAGPEDGASGWFFLQNRIDPAQFKAWRIDSERALILEHTHSDVLNEGIAHSWDEVASLGVDADLLAKMTRTGENERSHGATFERFVRAQGATHGVCEVWWNANLRLASRIVRDVGEERHAQVLVSLDVEPEGDLLRLPAERHPTFHLVDLADWREDCQGHGPAVAAAGIPCAEDHR